MRYVPLPGHRITRVRVSLPWVDFVAGAILFAVLVLLFWLALIVEGWK